MSEHPERAELSAWIDGEIPGHPGERIAAHIAACEQCAGIIAAYRANDRAARDVFARLAHESAERPSDRILERVRATRGRHGRIAAAAAVVAVLALAATLIGRLPFTGESRDKSIALARTAIEAHAQYAPDAVSPNAPTTSGGGVAGWLSDVLGRSLEAPGLERMGYRLVNARRLPDHRGDAAILQYLSPDGHRITCYFANRPRDADTGMQFVADGPVGVFYSVDDGLAYAVVGDIGREALRTIAREAYESVQRGYAPGRSGY